MNALFLFANGKWDIMRMGGYGYVWPNIMSNYDILKSMPNYQFFLVVVWHSLRCSNKRFQKRSSSKTEYNLWNYIEQWFVTIYLMTVSLWRTKFRISEKTLQILKSLVLLLSAIRLKCQSLFFLCDNFIWFPLVKKKDDIL